MKAYKIYSCRIEGGKNWSGVVIDTTESGVSEAIKKKFGLDYLYCERFPNKKMEEMYGKQYDYEEIPIESIQLNDLTVGELMGILNHRND